MSSGFEPQRQIFIVPNPLGLHARAASKLTQVATKFESTIHIELADQGTGPRANGKSVLDILTLGAEQGSRLNIICHGPDAEKAMDEISRLFDNNLGD